MKKLQSKHEIPEEFNEYDNKWRELASTWFFDGFPVGTKFNIKEGIDRDYALRHCRALLTSFGLERNIKITIVAFFISQWFDSIDVPKSC